MGVLQQPQVQLNKTGPSDDEMAFLRAIKDSDPDEDTARLVYADWLDENGPPERQRMGYAIRENIHFRRASHQAYVEPGAHKRHTEYDNTVKSYKAAWYGHDLLNWETADNKRQTTFLGGMLIAKGEPCDLNKIPLSAAPWVQKLMVRGPNGGAGGVITAMERTRAIEIHFASEYTGTRVVLERYVRSLRRQYKHAWALRYLTLGVWPTSETFDHLLHWHPDLIKKMVRVKVLAGSRRNDHAYAMYRTAALRTQRLWASTSGRDIIELPEGEK